MSTGTQQQRQTAYHYPADARFADDKDFLAWIEKLEAVMAAWGRDKGGPPYSAPLAVSTGLECWHDPYVDGCTPEQAFADDMSNWDTEDA